MTPPTARTPSAPAETRGYVFENRLDDVGVVIHAELIGDGQQQRIRLGDGFVLLELFDQRIRLGRIAAAKNGAFVAAEIADGIALLVAASEIGAVAVVHEREDAAAHRDPRRARVTCRFPRLAEFPDLLRLLDVERPSALVDFERRTLQVHAELGGPFAGSVGCGPPPNTIAQTLRVWLKPQQARRIRKHRLRVRLSKAVAAQR